MRKRSTAILAVSAMLTFALTVQGLAIPAGAVTRAKSSTSSDSNESSGSNSNSGSTSKTSNKSSSGENIVEYTDEGAQEATAAAAEVTSDSSTDGSSKTSTKSSSKSSTKSSSKSSSSGSAAKYDDRGNLILMTDSQRRAKWRSRTNPKRGTDPGNTKFRPAYNGFTYADFGTCNSYNSDNHLGGQYMYLLGTIMDIEKVYENPAYYGVAIMVNDCDGYQWYMRAYINKLQYANFRALFLGKSGYIFGYYSGYSGVTNRPMMDMTVMYPNGGFATNLSAFQ